MSSSPAAEHGVDEVTGRWVILAAILASSMAFIDSTALNVVLPALQSDLHAAGADLLWVINAYLLMLASLILLGGSLGDLYGRKRVFMIGITIFALASLASGIAPSTELLIAARVIQGLGAALLVPGSLAIITALIPAGRRGRAIGMWGTFTSLVTIIGPWLGGELADVGLWRAVFFINIPLAVLALGALYWRVPESRDEQNGRRLDWVGALLATPGLAGITFGFIEGARRGMDKPLVLVALAGGVVALIAFVWVETRSAHPMVPLGLFRSRTFSGTNLLTLFLYAALNAALFFLPLNLIQIQGYSESIAGRATVPFALLLALLSRWAGGLVDRVGPRPPLIIGPALTGIGFALLALPGMTSGPGDYWATYFPGLVAAGIGMGLTVAPLTTAVMGAVPQTRAGIASGINNAVARTAGTLAVAILGALALTTFSAALQARTADLALPGPARADLRIQAGQFADAQVPEAVPTAQRPAVAQAINLAFVDVFRLMTLIAAGLAWLGSLVTILMVRREPEPS